MDHLPQEMIYHTGIERLDLHTLGIKTIPVGPYLASLLVLNVDETYLTQIPEDVFLAPNLHTFIFGKHL